MTMRWIEQKFIKEVAARRAEELGDHVSSPEVALEFIEAGRAPG